MPSWVSITKPTQGDATKKSLADAIIDDLDYLYDSLGSGTGVINGSFETGTGTGEPVGWTRSSNPGSSGITSTTADVAHGAQAWYATSTGAGGCVLISTDFIECSQYVPVTLSWLMKGTADVKNVIKIKFYTDEQSSVSDTTIFSDDTTNPTTWTRLTRVCLPPDTARYMKIELTLCDSSDATSGSTYIDGIELLDHPAWFETGKTISEQTKQTDNWETKGTFTVDLGPLSGSSLVALRFTAEAYYEASASAFGIRFRIGSQYSNVIATANELAQGSYRYQSFLLVVSNLTGVQTVTMELTGDTFNGAGTYARKLDGEVSVEVLYP